jgi:hypothetical protein
MNSDHTKRIHHRAPSPVRRVWVIDLSDDIQALRCLRVV